MKVFKVIIAGSRLYTDYKGLKEVCDTLLDNVSKTCKIVIISGTARGADSLGELYAKQKGYEVMRFPANWDKYGKSAGYKRNVEMSEVANGCIVFLEGESTGSKHMINIAVNKKLPTYQVSYTYKEFGDKPKQRTQVIDKVY